ncbi:cytoplasmic tyrosine-protein kinase BMX-like [Pleurodeles waltl]|uniref:cytoplasmic tyrosine-protein kinase BMX-like n=1 Tax=Pleurodeles waltl TaxID=8319 RepID=UPI003709BE8F
MRLPTKAIRKEQHINPTVEDIVAVLNSTKRLTLDKQKCSFYTNSLEFFKCLFLSEGLQVDIRNSKPSGARLSYRTHRRSNKIPEETILEEVLLKRSHQKKKTSPNDYKKCLFVLTKERLTYYDYGKQKKGKTKGSIDIKHIQCVATVNNVNQTPIERQYPFQVIYGDCFLYIFPENEESRNKWLITLQQTIEGNPSLLTSYHNGFFTDGKFQCCNEVHKTATGYPSKRSKTIFGSTLSPGKMEVPKKGFGFSLFELLYGHLSLALKDKWTGPFEVKECKSDITYLVDLQTPRNPLRVLHANRLKPHFERFQLNMILATDDGVEKESEPLPDILSAREQDGSVEGVVFSPSFTLEQLSDCRQLLRQFSTLLSLTPGVTHLCTNDVNTGDSLPMKHEVYRLDDRVKASIKDEVSKTLALGVIESSSSPWSSPVVLVPKAAAPGAILEVWFCVDYHGLISVTKTDTHPIPTVDELIDQLGTAKFISTFDLTSGNWQIALTDGVKERNTRILGATEEENIENFEWFAGNISRAQSEQLLQQKGKEGSYMVRNSSKDGIYTVSIYSMAVRDKKWVVKHYHVHTDNENKVYLAENHCFDSIPKLINYHQHNCAGIITRLRHPVSTETNTVPSSAALGKGIWELRRSEITLLEELGSGQFGTVQRGRWKGKYDVAVKMIKEGSMSEDDFMDEAQTMMKLSHPKLVKLYGVCTQQYPIYIVTEYMANGSLLNYLQKNRSVLQPFHLTEMCYNVCEAMAFLERHSFIHRDLAARNCLVGKDLAVKVADFGMARFVLDDEYISSAGTKFPVKWAAPEVFNYSTFSSKSDVWAFGILMWEVFAVGKQPYELYDNAEVIQKISQGYRLYRPQLASARIHEIMSSCWHQVSETTLYAK